MENEETLLNHSLGIGLGATLPGMTHSKSGKEAETAVSPAMPVKSGKPHIILIMTDQQRQTPSAAWETRR